MKRPLVKARRYRITGADLMQTLDNWERLINFRISLIGCGGTALTLLGIKESTKDIDFIVPVAGEYNRLMIFLQRLGYGEKGGGLWHPDDPFFLYQFWAGDRVFTTDLLDSPLELGKNILIKKWRNIYLGALNLPDVIITKMFRGTRLDLEDCVAAFSKSEIDPYDLLERYVEAAKYDLNPDKMVRNFVRLVEELFEKRLVTERFLDKVKSHL